MAWEVFLALSPIVLILVLLFLFKKPLYFSSPLVFIFTAFLALFIWRITLVYLISSISKGFLVAFDIIIIIFGAIFFLEFLKSTGLLDNIKNFLNSISPDKRIQTILLVWFFGSFIEGTAGFGTPAAIVAPLLVGIGFNAITAVAVSLIGNTTAVAFGAVGTPIRIGFSGLIIEGVPFYAGLINLFAGILVPLMLVSIVVISEKRWKFKDILEMVPFSIYAGLCFTIPYFLLTFVGQEFPSLIGPLFGMLIITLTTKKGFLVPKNIMVNKSKRINEKEVNNKNLKNKNLKNKNSKNKKGDSKEIKGINGIRGIKHSILPYIFLVLFLVVGKFTLPSYDIDLFGKISHSLNLFNPGFAFLFAILFTSLIYKVKFSMVSSSAKEAFFKLLAPFITIFFLVSVSQIMIYSGNNTSGMESMLETVAVLIKIPLLPLISPLIGAFGSFIAGSATVSNVLFGNFQSSAANFLGYNSSIILALQLVGAGIGNMIALTNIVAAQATVKLKDKETSILRLVFVPFLIYILTAGLIGLILIRFFG